MHQRSLSILYAFSDWLAALLAWVSFFYFRQVYIENADFTVTTQFWYGVILIPLSWTFLFGLSGAYYKPNRRYRMKEFSQVFFISIAGTLFLFFALVLNDAVPNYKFYYRSFFVLFSLLFLLTLIPRLFITSRLVKSIHKGTRGFNTLLVGGSQKAKEILHELDNIKQSEGFDFKGFIKINGVDDTIKDRLPQLGSIEEINAIIDTYKIEEIIIAVESSEHNKLKEIINKIDNWDVAIKISPDMYDILSGSVKMNNILGTPLMEVNPEVMPAWQQSTKRIIDIFFSLTALIILFPVFLILAVLVKAGSKGPVFFSQTRVGKNGIEFHIYKFRSMIQNAEKNGPQLSSDNDMRITKIGRFMRKTRLDEIPQFFNVLKGEMSLVGPRPERQFFIDEIMRHDPSYRFLNRVRPGITSWGQVKFGYAENVEQMLRRMKYDLLYLENRSLAIDFKIMLYTVRTILKGSGK